MIRIVISIAACVYVVVKIVEHYKVDFLHKPKGQPISFLFVVYMTWVFLMCFSGAFVFVLQTKEYIVTYRQDWKQINATLTSITPCERVRQNIPENILSLNYDYVVNGITYKTTIDHIIPTDQFADDEMTKVNESEKIVHIYYNRNNPEETNFGDLPFKMNLLEVIFLNLICLFLVWGGGRILIRNYKLNFDSTAGNEHD